jgi:hypothetical protein
MILLISSFPEAEITWVSHWLKINFNDIFYLTQYVNNVVISMHKAWIKTISVFNSLLFLLHFSIPVCTVHQHIFWFRLAMFQVLSSPLCLVPSDWHRHIWICPLHYCLSTPQQIANVGYILIPPLRAPKSTRDLWTMKINSGLSLIELSALSASAHYFIYLFIW